MIRATRVVGTMIDVILIFNLQVTDYRRAGRPGRRLGLGRGIYMHGKMAS